MIQKYISLTLFLKPLFSGVRDYLIRYPSPKNIGYMWTFGSLSGLFLVVQIVSGLFLVMFYTPHTNEAFNSLMYIMENINYGWLLRYIHANGASFFFLYIYIHMLRGIYYSSYQYPRTLIWITGILIYILLMGTAFLGYVLPWGQMSYWAATVITNFVTIIPFVGVELVVWVWGGYSIGNATLNRFFCLHYLLPFVVAVLVLVHLIVLHDTSSTNEVKIQLDIEDRISFFPYFAVKDIFIVWIVLFFFSYVVFFIPEVFNHSINYIAANPLVTPSHIVPEWYFLPYYAILRSIPNKTIGVIAMILSLVLFLFFPILDSGVRYVRVNFFFHKLVFWLFLFNFCFLGFLGSQTAEHPTAIMGQICTGIHVCYVFVYLTIATSFESHLMMVNDPLVPSFVSSKPFDDLGLGTEKRSPLSSTKLSKEVTDNSTRTLTTPVFKLVDSNNNIYIFSDNNNLLK